VPSFFAFLRVGWRQLRADPGGSAVIVCGLAVAVACAAAIAQVVADTVLPDPALVAPERLVRLEFHANFIEQPDDWFPRSPLVFAPALTAAGAPVQAIARSTGDEEAVVRVGTRLLPARVLFADPALAELFPLHAERGDVGEVLRRPDAVALSRAAAARLFPGEDALGRTVVLSGHPMVVTALLRDPSPRSRVGADLLASLGSPAGDPGDAASSWGILTGTVYARLAPGHSAAELTALAQDLFDRGPGPKSMPPEFSANGRRAAFVRAVPLSRDALDGAGGPQRRRYLAGLVAAGALMLVLAFANAANLTAVRTLRRVREIAVRKSLGASPAALATQFVAEAMLVAAVASAAGLLLAWLAGPWLVGLLSPARGARFAPAPELLAGLVAGVLALGALAGVLPARLAWRVRCAESLAGRTQDEGRAGLRVRRALTATQFAISLVLCAVAGAVAVQNHHVATLDRGFRTAGLLAIDFPLELPAPDALRLRDALAHEPAVRATAWSARTPADHPTGVTTFYARGDRRAWVRLSTVEPAFFGVYDIPLVAGEVRPPAPGAHDVVIDELALRAFGFANARDAIGGTIRGTITTDAAPRRVVAVVPRLRQEDARNPGQPQVIELHAGPLRTLTLRGDDVAAMQRAVAAAWPRAFPDTLPELASLEERLAQATADDRRIGMLAAAASAIALLLGGLGVYVFTAASVRRGARQIVLRKLHGAGRVQVAAWVAREFAPLLGAGALVALPLAGWLVHAWLGGFVERSDAAWWALPCALGVLGVVTALAAARHTLAAMALRPAAALRE